jgi:hypothetical protein
MASWSGQVDSWFQQNPTASLDNVRTALAAIPGATFDRGTGTFSYGGETYQSGALQNAISAEDTRNQQYLQNWAYKPGMASSSPTTLSQVSQVAPTTPTTTPQTQTTNTGLTLADLNNWWSQQQAAMQNGVSPVGGSGANSLGQLFPRTNWGNYQTSGRGGRYFDATSGRYQGLGNLQAAQPASL